MIMKINKKWLSMRNHANLRLICILQEFYLLCLAAVPGGTLAT